MKTKIYEKSLPFRVVVKNKTNLKFSLIGLATFIFISLILNIYSIVNLKIDELGYNDSNFISEKYVWFTLLLSIIIAVVFILLTSKILIGDIKNNMHKIEMHYGYSKVNIFFSRLGYLYLCLGICISINAVMGAIFYGCSNDILHGTAYQLFLANNPWLLLTGSTSILFTIILGFMFQDSKGNIFVSILLIIFIALASILPMILNGYNTEESELRDKLVCLVNDKNLYNQLEEDELGQLIFQDIDKDLHQLSNGKKTNVIDTNYNTEWNNMFSTLFSDTALIQTWTQIYDEYFKNLSIPNWNDSNNNPGTDTRNLVGQQYFNFFCYHSLDTKCSLLIDIANNVLNLSADNNYKKEQNSFFFEEFFKNNWHIQNENPGTIQDVFKYSIEHIYTDMIGLEMMFGDNNYYYQPWANTGSAYYLDILETMANNENPNYGIDIIQNYNKKIRKEYILNPINQLTAIFYGYNLQDPKQITTNSNMISTISVDNIKLSTNISTPIPPNDDQPRHDLNVKFLNIETVDLINRNLLIASYIIISLVMSNLTFFWFSKKISK
ncbi:hypothetical protein [Spiroplasma endosymbiont of Amphibalanus improvisus]|uniref:hypothetical protein n=1 Tax=Spiroplasma endosymbiont of Amphibalanus improvisus TaxID=3066327 RepID=UPI00313AD4A7